ncbi:MAG: hypothetical protein H6807_00070 [Planctomycetes bacterium]|nr:hypothetical protein [Planctomycetota bacterium]
MRQLFEVLDDLIVDHWAKILTGLVLLVLGRVWGRFRARREWQAKEFKNRLMVSMNSIVDGRLLIRTVLEKDMHEVLLNGLAVAALREAGQKTSESDPVIHLAEADRWHILNAVLNEVAENFKEGLFARDLGLPVVVGRYVFCLTNEVAGDLRTRKIRVMIQRPELLAEDGPELQSLELASPHHRTRLETLAAMRRQYRGGASEDFMTVELALPR